MKLFDIVLLLISFVALYFIHWLSKQKKYSFPTMLLLSLIIAAITGLGFYLIAQLLFNVDSQSMVTFDMYFKKMISASVAFEGLNFLKSLFTTLMRMMVVPLVLFSILNVVITQSLKSRKMLARIMVGFIVTVLLGAFVGFGLAYVFSLGRGIQFNFSPEDLERLNKYVQAVDNYSIFGLIQSFVPENIVSAMSANNVIGIMLFATLFGMGINRAKKRYQEETSILVKAINAIFAALTYMTRTILTILPYSIFAMIFTLVLGRDFSVFISLGMYFGVIFASMLLMFIVHLGVMMFQGLSPIQYIKNVLPAWIVAFSTSSSNATLPITMSTLKERAGVSESIGTLVPTLATSMGMTACAGIYPAVLVVLTLNMTNQPITYSVFLLAMLYGVLSSFGTQGIPGTATIAATFVLTGLGLPLSAIVFVAPIDFFVDMFRTMLNVNGGMVVAISVDHSQHTLDQNLFNQSK